MAFNLVAPDLIETNGVLPSRRFRTHAFYLGYGRNAWHSTWTNIYNPHSVSPSVLDLKQRAEKQRVQGSVFRIETIPMLVLEYPRHSFGICPINEGSQYEFAVLLTRIGQYPRDQFWKAFPGRSRNWLLTFDLEDTKLPPTQFQPCKLVSHSLGSMYCLGWTEQQGKPHLQFLTFSETLMREP